jgi:N-sulfoglucosamine sulfohydrolase
MTGLMPATLISAGKQRGLRAKLGLAALVLAVAALHGAEAARPARPNVLFILTEDQGAHLGFLGTPGLRTPHMDSLAQRGIYFDNAFVAYPVCSPSKAAIYTAQPSHVTGLLNNTPNFHKSAAELTAAERNHPLYRRNRIADQLPTLVERLHAAGYYQGVTSKLHVAPNEKFPYDEFIRGDSGKSVGEFIARAKQSGKPWHLFFNIGASHRPFLKRATQKVRVDPAAVKLPACLPDTPVVRLDWAEYLTAVEAADDLVGEGLAALRASGEEANTIVVCLGGDHGPAFQHGKMTLYDLGLRVTLSIFVPGLTGGRRSDALVSALDLSPTLLDLLGLAPLPATQGVSLRPLLEGKSAARPHDFVFAEISDRGPLPNDGMQERSVCDGRWHLIYREKTASAWRQVQADSKDWPVWRNRTYAETVRVKNQFPLQFRILAEMDPQALGGQVPVLELYDLKSDPDEMHNLAQHAGSRGPRDRLFAALRDWVTATHDTSVNPPLKLP